MHTDPIADMLTRIRNAQAVNKTEVVLPYSKLKIAVLGLLLKEGWVDKVEKVAPSDSKTASKNDTLSRFDALKVKIKYEDVGIPKIRSIKRISKPGRRVYVDKDNIPVVLNSLGIAVISTSQGLMTDDQAREKKVGGEIICEIY